MLDIGTIINALTTVASAVDRIQERQKAKQEIDRSRELEKLPERLKELEEANLEQGRLIGELSRDVKDLAKAIDIEIEKNRIRDARTLRLVWAALGVGIAALAVGIAALVRVL